MSDATDHPITDDEKRVLSQRLQREGRYDEFMSERAEIQQEKRANGVPRAIALSESWREAAERFPPQPVDEKEQKPKPGKVSYLTAEEVEILDAKPDPSFTEEVQWVYDNFANKDVRPVDALATSTWGLLQWARGSQVKFYGDLVPKFIAAPQEEADKAAKAQKGESSDKLLELTAKLQEEAAAGRARTVTCPKCQTEVPCPVRYGGDPVSNVLEGATA